MWLVILEACFAFCVFVFIVWWTMFCGRQPRQLSKDDFHDNQKSHIDSDDPA